MTQHGCIPYCCVLQLLAIRYLGAGLLDAEFMDNDYPYRSSKSFSCMFWNLGNWQRTRFLKKPLPKHLEKYRNHINFDFDSEHRLIGDKPLYNNFFVNVVKNSRTHLFMNFEAASIFEHKERIEEGGYKVCFNDYQDLMVAARIRKDGYVKQIAGYKTEPTDTRARFVSWAIFEIVWGTTLNGNTGEEENLTRGRIDASGCVYHVGQEHIGRAALLCGEIIATMCWECICYQDDVMAGDGNKAAHLSTPKYPGCPTYEVSLLQFWIDRMVNTATQSRLNNYGTSPPVRTKHFITCSYNDLVHLSHHLRGIKTETCTEELASKTFEKGD